MGSGSTLADVGALLALPVHTSRRKAEQWLTGQRLADLRNQRLRRVLKEARSAPWYRRVIPPVPARPLDTGFLGQLPFLTKRTISSEGLDAFLTAGRHGLLTITTSGSTGEPGVFLRSPLEEAEFSARWWRVYAAHGGNTRDSLLNVGRANARPRRGPVKAMRDFGLLPKIENVSVSSPIADAVDTVYRFRPRFITGFAIGIEAMAEHMLQHGIEIPPPKAVICGAMDVTEHCRSLVHRAFHSRAVNVYATNEFGVIGWECPLQHGRLHVNEDMLVLEIVNGDEPVPDGMAGEVVLTSLTLTRMPLIRFRTGDIAARVRCQCKCGRGLSLMTSVQGRTAHSIRGSDGRVLTAPLLASAFRDSGAYEWARRFQVQERPGGILCVLVVPRRLPDENERRRLLDTYRELAGPEFTPELELRDELQLAPTGKFQYVIPLAARNRSPAPPIRPLAQDSAG